MCERAGVVCVLMGGQLTKLRPVMLHIRTSWLTHARLPATSKEGLGRGPYSVFSVLSAQCVSAACNQIKSWSKELLLKALVGRRQGFNVSCDH